MRRWLVVLAFLCLPIAALAGLTSRDSTYDNACAITGTCTGGGGTASPIMLEHIASSTNPPGNGITGHAFKIQVDTVPTSTVIVVAVSYVHGKTYTMSDTLGLTWTQTGCTADAGTGNNVSSIWWAATNSSTSGTDTITMNPGTTATQPFQFDLTLWQNISTTSPVNGKLCTANITPTASPNYLVDPGSFTPTNNDANGGNVIYNYSALCAGGNATQNPTSFTAGTSFTLLNADNWGGAAFNVGGTNGFPEAAQYYVQTTAAAIDAKLKTTGDTTDCYNSSTVALAVANNSQTAPSTLHVAKIIHESWVTFNSPATFTVNLPTVGNLRVATFTWAGGCPGAGTGCLGSMSSSDGCSWTLLGSTGGTAAIGYAQNCSPCPNCTVSVVFTGTQTGMPQGSFRLYDIQNALASSYQNSTFGFASTCNSTWTNMPGSFTPSGASSGLVIHAFGNGDGPVPTLTSPSGAFNDLWEFTGITDSDVADNSDETDHEFYSGSPSLSWSGTKTHTADQCYYGAAAFN